MMTKYVAGLMTLLLCGVALGPGMAKAEVFGINEHLVIEVGSTEEWDGGDYVALNMTKGDSTAWFGVVYGNETHNNSVTIVAAHLRFLGGAEVRNEAGAIMVPATGIPVLTVYIQKLAALIEFSDTGYLTWDNELIGADNGVFDFVNTGEGATDFGVSSVEPVHKILDLNRSWELSEITEIETLGSNEKEWEFTLSAENVLYDKIWDNQPPVNDDGSRPGLPVDGNVSDIAFTFHLGSVLDEYNVSVPWYRVTYGDQGIIDSEEVEPREYEGTSLITEFKFDHWIKGWDYQSKENLLMLETVTAFGTFIPEIVQDWLDVQFVNETVEEPITVAEIETFTGGEADMMATDGIPNGSHRLSKDSIVFKDNWQKVGEMTWVSNVTVDNLDEDMHFQIHAGENINWPTEEENGYVNGIIFLGGYIYPMGHDIFHDPSYVAHALFLDIGVGFGGFGHIQAVVGFIVMAAVAAVSCTIIYLGIRRIRTLP